MRARARAWAAVGVFVRRQAPGFNTSTSCYHVRRGNLARAESSERRWLRSDYRWPSRPRVASSGSRCVARSRDTHDANLPRGRFGRSSPVARGMNPPRADGEALRRRRLPCSEPIQQIPRRGRCSEADGEGACGRQDRTSPANYHALRIASAALSIKVGTRHLGGRGADSDWVLDDLTAQREQESISCGRASAPTITICGSICPESSTWKILLFR